MTIEYDKKSEQLLEKDKTNDSNPSTSIETEEPIGEPFLPPVAPIPEPPPTAVLSGIY